tara:strand:+ start:232 stop:648 length:417 start_codon:yes stop_codon:yes gene_type:complete
MSKHKRKNKNTYKRKPKYKYKKVNKKCGSAYIHSSYNNTIVTITDELGNTLSWASGGIVGFKGSRRSSAYAAQRAAGKAGRKARILGWTNVNLYLKGIGKGRYTVMKGLRSSGIKVRSVTDITPLAHNGCRPPKKRRV